MLDVPRHSGLLLMVGPLVGAVPIANPALSPVWSASREAHLAIVGVHRRARHVAAGDTIPALRCPPTTLVGPALVVGWS